MKRISSGIVFFLLWTEFVIGQQTILNEEFWYDLQPEIEGWETVQGKEPFPDLHTLSKDEMFNRILEEARYVFSGMVYGFTFSYTPYDKSRGVEEEFLLEPYQWIQRGDPNLQVFGVRTEGSRVFVRIRYSLRDFQESWYQGLRSNVVPFSAGEGEAPFYLGPEGRVRAIQEGIKNAVREYARGIVYNKPRNLQGLIVLDAAPRIRVQSGAYRARIGRAFVRLEEITTYQLY